MAQPSFRIAFLHLAPVPADLHTNRRAIETAISQAAQEGASWILTPELGVCGYAFAETLGTDWIEPQPDQWMSSLCRLATRLGITLLLSHPERDRTTNRLHNSLFAITAAGCVAGSHRKVNTLRVGSEAWSSPGHGADAIPLSPIGPVGLLVCADAYSPAIAIGLKAQGARMLVSSAAWGAGLPRAERGMGTLHPRHRFAPAGLQSNRPRPYTGIHPRGKRGGAGRTAPALPPIGTRRPSSSSTGMCRRTRSPPLTTSGSPCCQTVRALVNSTG